MSMFCHPCVVVFTWATWAIFHTKNGYVFSLVYTKTAEESKLNTVLGTAELKPMKIHLEHIFTI